MSRKGVIILLIFAALRSLARQECLPALLIDLLFLLSFLSAERY